MKDVKQKNLTSSSPKPKMLKGKLKLWKLSVLNFLRSRFVDNFKGCLWKSFYRASHDKYLIIIKSSINKHLIKIILRASDPWINLRLGLQHKVNPIFLDHYVRRLFQTSEYLQNKCNIFVMCQILLRNWCSMCHDSVLMGIQLPKFRTSLLFPSSGCSNYVPISTASYSVTEEEGLY
jgi:hypothetical protein